MMIPIDYSFIYIPWTKEQKQNYNCWLKFYQEKYHIAKFRAERLAGKKKNIKFYE